MKLSNITHFDVIDLYIHLFEHRSINKKVGFFTLVTPPSILKLQKILSHSRAIKWTITMKKKCKLGHRFILFEVNNDYSHEIDVMTIHS